MVWFVFNGVIVFPSLCLFARGRETSLAALFAFSNITSPNGLRLHVESQRRSSAIQVQTGDTLDQTPVTWNVVWRRTWVASSCPSV